MSDDILLTQNDLIGHLNSNLPAGYTKAKIKYPNAPFTTPKNDKWLRITMIDGIKANVAAGGCWKRTQGILAIDVFYPVDTGSKAQLTDVKLIQALYENKQIGNAKCLEADVNIIGESDAWYIVQVQINYTYEGA